MHICIATPFSSFLCGETSPKIGVVSRNCKERGKMCLLKPLYEGSGRNDKRCNGELHIWSSKPREMQMTGETSPCQQQPTLLWPTALSDGWICAGMVHEQGPPGERGGEADQSALKPYIQKHIPQHFFQKLSNYCLTVHRGLQGFEMQLSLFQTRRL